MFGTSPEDRHSECQRWSISQELGIALSCTRERQAWSENKKCDQPAEVISTQAFPFWALIFARAWSGGCVSAIAQQFFPVPRTLVSYCLVPAARLSTRASSRQSSVDNSNGVVCPLAFVTPEVRGSPGAGNVRGGRQLQRIRGGLDMQVLRNLEISALLCGKFCETEVIWPMMHPESHVEKTMD